MSKPIKLTEELLQKIKEEFAASVKNTKMLSGRLEYSRSFKWEGTENKRAVIFITSIAFAKMNALIQRFDSEIAWHGIVHRDEKKQNVFHITDIIVYPQTVTGSTVETDQDAYQTWLYSFDDEVFDNIRMQGHSHVRMSVSPSGVDTTHQEKILSQVADDDYYIFMIWNKQYEHFVRIFDMKNNTLYETEDVDVLIGDNRLNLAKFMEDTEKIVTKKSCTSYYQRSVTPATYDSKSSASSGSGVKTKPKALPGADIGKPYSDYMRYRQSVYDEEDDGYTGVYDC